MWKMFSHKHEVGLKLCLIFVAGLVIPSATEPITENQTLVVSARNKDSNTIRLNFIRGDPYDWIQEAAPRNMYAEGGSQVGFNAIAFNYKKRLVYVSDSLKKRLVVVKLSNVSSVSVKDAPISTKVDGLAYDWINNRLYWSDVEYQWIKKADPNNIGTTTTSVVTNIAVPRGIAVHPFCEYLFWADANGQGKIMRSNLDGEEKVTLVDNALNDPFDITIDFDRHKIVWTNRGTGRVEMSNFDGSERKIVFYHGSFTFAGIALFYNLTFTTDQTNDRFVKFNLGSLNTNLLYFNAPGMGKTYGIAMFAQRNQPETVQGDTEVYCKRFVDTEKTTPTEPPTANFVPIIAGVVGGGGVLIVLIVVIGCVISRNKRSQDKPYDYYGSDGYNPNLLRDGGYLTAGSVGGKYDENYKQGRLSQQNPYSRGPREEVYDEISDVHIQSSIKPQLPSRGGISNGGLAVPLSEEDEGYLRMSNIANGAGNPV